MKKIYFEPEVPAQLRAIPQHIAMTILEAIHRYAESGTGRVKPLSGEFEGFLRLRVGNHRVFFKETAEAITIHRIRDRRSAYR
ncbi:MAG: type II toxin-antitoxin system RelE/ParE family toxin [Bryobacterales bacterium]|nr:type II toxin-antitoxin system RelE/ParE family toxin [Bryobacterales bacterium]